MARPSKLKVFRTPIGFHDAYVAAPSKKAAIEAWGSDKDVFARGEAELVTNPALAAEPLASPGKVVKRLRGTAAEHFAALPSGAPKRRSFKPSPSKPARTAKAVKPKPRPSRAALEAAEEAVAAAEERHGGELWALAEREAALARERQALQKKQSDEIARLGRARDKAAAAYETAMRKWRG